MLCRSEGEREAQRAGGNLLRLRDCKVWSAGGGAESQPVFFYLVVMATNEMKNSKYPPFANTAKSGHPPRSSRVWAPVVSS